MPKTRPALAALLMLAPAMIAGCTAPGEQNRADVFSADQVNTRQAAQVVNILAVLPAKVEVDNSENQRTAQLIGGLVGGLGGGVLGGTLASHQVLATTALGGAGGGALGVAAGSLVPGTALVPGVSLAYEQDGKTFSSAQVGRTCEYMPGHALIVQTSPNSTRIQPNAACPAPAERT